MASTGLTRHGREVGSVFDLLGRDENDLTAALAYTLARSPALLSGVKSITPSKKSGASARPASSAQSSALSSDAMIGSTWGIPAEKVRRSLMSFCVTLRMRPSTASTRYVALAVSDWSLRDASLIALTITPPSAPA
jgi:hypothetical protein